MPTASPALLPMFISFDDGDDDFGEFEFANPASASSPPPLLLHSPTSGQQEWQKVAGEEDDDWGDFVESPLRPQPFTTAGQQQWQKAAGVENDDWGDFVESPLHPQPFSTSDPPLSFPSSSSSSHARSSSFFDPFLAPPAAAPDPTPTSSVSPAAAGKGWQRPSGALPLSLFGEDDEEDGGEDELPTSLHLPTPDLKAGAFPSSKSPGSFGLVSAPQGAGLKDLIASLYGQADTTVPATAGTSDGSSLNSKIHSDNVVNSDFAGGGNIEDDKLHEDGWEFKDALSGTVVGDSGDSVLVEMVKKEGEITEIPGVEAKATDGCSGFQSSGNYILKSNGQKCENTLGANDGNLPDRVLSDGREWASAFVSHDATVNGFYFKSADDGCNGYTLNTHDDLKHVNIENGLNPNLVNGDMSLDDSSWGFKDAYSNTESVSCFTEIESIGQVGLNEVDNLYVPACSSKNEEFGDPFLIIEGSQYLPNSIENGTEDLKAGSVVGLNDFVSNMYNVTHNISAVTSKQITYSDQNSVVSCETLKGADNIDLKSAGLESDKGNNIVSDNMGTWFNISTEPTMFVDFYCRLKQRSCTLALHHIHNLKLMKAHEKEVPHEELKAGDLDDKIKATSSKLRISALGSDHIEKCQPNEFPVGELLEVIRTPGFGAFDMEFSLSEKIPLAEKDLNSAMWLFEHASYVLHILTLASYEEQCTYIISWSKMVSACEIELQHGSTIWSQAVHANIQTELLSEFQAQKYFLSLGEIYRVVEILSASIRLYKPWILINPADSMDMLTRIAKSAEAWKDAGLKRALETISERFDKLKLVTEELLESIRFISELSAHTLQNHPSNHATHFCRLSLLPLEIVRDMKQVVWHGDHYFSKLANLWANRISCDAPQLPHVNVGQ